MSAPRLLAPALVMSFITVGIVLAAAFAALSLQVRELRRCIGSDCDGPSVEALVAALPRLVAAPEPPDSMGFQWAQPRARSA